MAALTSLAVRTLTAIGRLDFEEHSYVEPFAVAVCAVLSCLDLRARPHFTKGDGDVISAIDAEDAQ